MGAILSHAQRYTGKALELWKEVYPAIQNDSVSIARLQDSIEMAIEQNDWRRAVALQDTQWNRRLDWRVRMHRVERAQATEKSEQASLRAEKNAIENRIREHQLQIKQANNRRQRMQQMRDSANLVMMNLQLEKERLKEDEQNDQAKAELENRVLNEVRRNRQILVLYFTCWFGFLALLLLIIFTDVRRRNNRKLSEANRKVAEARDKTLALDRMKTLLVQNMSHEIRSPLNAIVGFSEMLSESSDALSEEDRKSLSTLITQNSEQLIAIISDIIDMSDLESGLLKMELAPTNVNEACNFALKTTQGIAREGVKVYFTTEVEDTFVLQTDERRLRQVLVNYLSNACKHTSEGEIHLHASTTENKGYITFSVTDTGAGVPPEKRHLLFKRFEKLNDRQQGTGLGLNICRLIAEQLHGEARLDTKYTKRGSRFLFLHPLKVLLLGILLLGMGGQRALAQRPVVGDVDYAKRRASITEMKENAVHRGDKYGLVEAEKAMGDLFMEFRFFRMAYNHYQQATEYCVDNLPDMDAASLYNGMIESAEQFGLSESNPAEFRTLVDEGLNLCKSDTTETLMQLWKLRVLCAERDSTSFFSQWDGVRSRAMSMRLQDATPFQICEVMSHLFHSETRSAINYIQSISRSSGAAVEFARMRLLGDAYMWTRRIDRAFDYRKQLYHMHDSLMENTSVQELTRFEMHVDAILAQDSVHQARNRFLRIEEERMAQMDTLLRMQADSVQAESEQVRLALENAEKRTRLDEAKNLQAQSRYEHEQENEALSKRAWVVAGVGLLLGILLTGLLFLQNFRQARRLRAAHAELEDALREAEDQDAKKTAFIQGLSHQVRTPLNAIVGFSDILASYGETLAEEERKQLASQVRDNSSRISELVNDILMLSRLESGRTVPVFKPSNLHALCLDTLSTMSMKAHPGVEWELDYQLPEDTEVVTDAAILGQMLQQLLSNAFKFTEQGRVRLVAKRNADNAIVLHIEDTGRGIPSHMVDRLFERFTKGDSFTKGTGLGLAIVRTAADCLHLHVRLDESYTQGARFEILIK